MNKNPLGCCAYAALLLCLPLLLVGCGTLDEQYVEADRATFNSLEPFVRSKADPVEDESKLLVLDSWKLRLETAEGGQ